MATLRPDRHSALRAVTPWRDLKKIPRSIWVLFVAVLVNRMGTMVLAFMTLYVTNALHLRAQIAGWILSIYGAATIVVAPLAGRLSDRFGPAKVMKACLSASGLILLLFPWARSLPALFGATACFAVTSESFRPASMASIGTLVPPQLRRSAFALNRLALNLGFSVGPVVGGFLAQRSYFWLFMIDGLTSVLAAVILIGFSFHVRPEDPGLPDHSGSGALSRADLFFLLGVVAVGMVFFQFSSTMPLFFHNDLHLSEVTIGLLFALNTLLIVLLEIPLTSAICGWDARRSMFVGALLLSGGFGGFALSNGVRGAAMSIVLWTVGEMILLPALPAYVAEVAPAGQRGRYMGLFSMSMGAAMALAPTTGVQILQRYGASTLWSSIFALGVVSALLLKSSRSNTPLTLPR